ncbi:MAG: ABC transporter ATP-binding protein [Bdellovibrionales bacterium]|nr:ABC transporter ATP-binding protein [Bdellovibrionales bacterium]
MIEVSHLHKNFGSLAVLKDISFRIPTGSWAALTGPSGSGKTTLLGLLAGLDAPSSGSIQLENTNLSSLSEDSRAEFRARHMGFVFQSFRLIPHLTALENVRIPLELVHATNINERAQALLSRVGLADRLHHRPAELSGGEQQRVAVARAFVTKPRFLLADEPTGNLDSKNGARILELIHELQNENGSTVLVVTHDPAIAAQAKVQLRLKDGELEG